MGEFDFDVGIAFGPQVAIGTMDPAIAALTGALVLNDGILLGSALSGKEESGIDFATSRGRTPRPNLSGSFTRQASEFRKEIVETFIVAFPLAGNREDTTPVTPVDGDFEHNVGIKSILACCGVTGIADPSGIGFRYTPTGVAGNQASAALWMSGIRYHLKDIFGSIRFDITPNQIGLAIATLTAVVDAKSNVTQPTFAYGRQASQAAPLVQSVGHVFAAGAVARAYTAMSIEIDNDLQLFPNSNVDGGEQQRQGDRKVKVTATLLGESTDISAELDNLRAAAAPTDDLSFTVGTAAAPVAPALAYKVEVFNPEVISHDIVTVGKVHATTVEMEATQVSGSEDDELRLTFL